MIRTGSDEDILMRWFYENGMRGYRDAHTYTEMSKCLSEYIAMPKGRIETALRALVQRGSVEILYLNMGLTQFAVRGKYVGDKRSSLL